MSQKLRPSDSRFSLDKRLHRTSPANIKENSKCKDRASFASGRSMAQLRNCNELLESSSEFEIIDASIQEWSSEFDWIKTPRSARKQLRVPNPGVDPYLTDTHQIKKLRLSTDRVTTSIRRHSSDQDELPLKRLSNFWVPSSQIKAVNRGESPIQVLLGKNDKRISPPLPLRALNSHRDSPSTVTALPASLLNGSKKRNVEAWLANALDQPVTTPPMSLSPVRRKPSAQNPSKIDPEVEDVLKAVYGDNWKEKSCKKSKTDVKKDKTRQNRIQTLATDSKATRGRNNKDVFEQLSNKDEQHFLKSRNVRRKIFNDNGPLDLNEKSHNSEVEASLLKSQDLDKISSTQRNVTKRKRNVSVEISSIKPMSPVPAKKPAKRGIKTPDTCKTPLGLLSSNTKTPRRTFLASLSVSTPTSIGHPEARSFKINFSKKKDELCALLYKLYNTEVFGNQLPEDMSIKWNPKMRGTAGYCYSKRKKSSKGLVRLARVELSPCVVDRADRLRDTLIHELCHAAAWIIDGVMDGHGAVWSAWARKASLRFPELPAIRRCHNYQIATKYTYRCTMCGYTINRQSRSIDTERKRCGHCLGILELLVNKKKRGKLEAPEFETTRTIRAPNNFALFVKENYKRIKEENPGKKHGEVMKLLSQQYAVYKSVVTPGKK